MFDLSKFEYMKNDNAVVILGDCIQVMETMEEKSVDLIFADPPYNLKKDFGNKSDDWKDREKYFQWCYQWIDACFRILKDDGTAYLMNSTQNMPYISTYIQEHYHLVCDIVWAYDSSGVQPKNKFGSLYEPIIMVTKSKKAKYTFNSQDILIEAKTGSQRKLINYRKNPPEPYNDKKIPGNVWEFPRVRYKMSEYENHPSQKPEVLLERIIKTSSNEGDVVFDPFSGTFSTCATALKLGRKAIGIDLTKDYFLIGIRRCGMSDTYNGLKLEKDLGRKTKNLSKNERNRKAPAD